MAGILVIGTGMAETSGVFLPSLAVVALGMTVHDASFFMLWTVAALVVGSPLAGRLLDKIGSKIVVQAGLLLTALGIFCFALAATSSMAFIVGQLLSGPGLSALLGAPLRYVVRADGSDDQQDPIADAARAILDGHIVLSRDLADAGHYPAIDIEASISRVQPDLLTEDELDRTRRFKYLYSRYMRSRDLLAVGAYVPGADLVLDEGVRLYPRMQAYLMQGMREHATLESARAGLEGVLG